VATIASLKRRIKKLEKASQQREKVMSRFSEECICFPEGHAPHIKCGIKRAIALIVKCPTHGDRFRWEDAEPLGYQSSWLEEFNWRRVLTRNWLDGWTGPRYIPEQYCKAFLASFPADLWSVKHEEEWEGDVCKTYVRLQDGTRIQVGQFDDPDMLVLQDGGRSLSPTFKKRYGRNWQTETLQTMARLLLARGRIVDPRVICVPEEEISKKETENVKKHAKEGAVSS
jgi:hypothetical protein